ncbi:MAG: ATP-binding protein [Bacteroidia bacterium]
MKESSVFSNRLLLILFFAFILIPSSKLRANPLLPSYQQLELKNPTSLGENLIKSIIEDEQGSVWLLTDAGLLRYEQAEFRLFKRSADLVYPKSMLRTREGLIWILGDMGLMQMTPSADTVKLQLRVAGSTKDEVDKIHYGKNLYEDKQGILWLGGIQDIYRYQDGKLHPYPLGGRFWTEDFDHGFAFTETKNGRLWAASYTGQIGYYQRERDTWIWLPERGISQVGGLGYDSLNHSLWLGTYEGLLQLSLDEYGFPDQEHWIQQTHPITSLSLSGDKLWWANKSGAVFIRSLRENAQIQAGDFPGQEISSIYSQNPLNIWIATDNGLGLLYPCQISPVSTQDEAHRYIESVLTLGETTYFCDRFRLYSQRVGEATKVLLDDPDSYLLGLTYAEGKLWIFSRKGIQSWQDGKSEWIKREVGDFFMPATDQTGQVWVCHMDRPGVSSFDSALNRYTYYALDAPELSFGVIRKSPAGTLYLGGKGPATLLYRYDREQDKLVNLLVNQPLPADIKIQDMAIGKNEKIWLATNEGLFYWEKGNKVLKPYPLQSDNPFPSISAIFWQDDHKIWIAEAGELILLDPIDAQQFRFNRWNGLPNGDIAAHNITAEGERLLIGTHQGLFQLPQSQLLRSATPVPMWKLPSMAPTKLLPQDSLYNLALNAEVSFYPSIQTGPTRMLEFRYRIASKTPHWKYIKADQLISYKGRKMGDDKIELQARRYGYFEWSDSRILNLEISRPWFLNPITWLCSILLIALSIITSVRIKSKYFERKEAHFKKLVDRQTAALSQSLIRERNTLMALKQSENRYRMLFECARDGILIIKDDKVVDANEEAWKMFGYDRDSFIGISLCELYPNIQPDGRLSEEKALRQLARSRWDAYCEHWQQKRKDGSLFDAEISLNRMRIEGESYIQVIFRNITERIAAKEEQAQQLLELNQKNQELKKAIASNAELENFAYVVSHDLRQPLRSISSFANLLQRRYLDRLDDEGQEFLDFVVRGAKSMNELILHLLDFSRITRTVEPQTWVFLPNLINEVLGLLQKQIVETHTKIDIGEIPPVKLFGHRTQLLRLIQNLLSNAIKFHKEGEVPQVELRMFIYQKQLHLQVEDNGIGIDPDNYERIFWLFQRLNSVDEFEGSGIGLSVCKKIVEHHSGQIKVSSNSTQGSVFEICLPHFSDSIDLPEPEVLSLPKALTWLQEENG